MEPEVRLYFRKILRSFSWTLLWMITVSTAGIFFKLGFLGDGVRWYNYLFYLLALISFFFLLRFLYRLWK
jgi:hypothetical protein